SCGLGLSSGSASKPGLLLATSQKAGSLHGVLPQMSQVVMTKIPMRMMTRVRGAKKRAWPSGQGLASRCRRSWLARANTRANRAWKEPLLSSEKSPRRENSESAIESFGDCGMAASSDEARKKFVLSLG